MSSVEAARKGQKSERNDNIKHAVKLRKVEVLSKQLLDEWSSLPPEKKEEAVSVIAGKFLERVPPEYLVTMAEQFAAASDGGAAAAAAAAAEAPSAEQPPEAEEAAEAEPAEAEQAEAEGAEDYAEGYEEGGEAEAEGGEAEAEGAEAWGEAEAEGTDGGAEAWGEAEPEGAEGGAEAWGEAAKDMLALAQTEPMTEWGQAWTNLGVTSEDEASALTALLDAALRGAAAAEVTANLLIELTRGKLVELPNLEAALLATARQLEEFIETDDAAWQHHGQILAQLFPFSPSSTWGLKKPGWSWTHWWAMAEKVLSAADPFRAFDILILVLQICQEKGDKTIKTQAIWRDGGRVLKVQKLLCSWAEIDQAAITETLVAYGLEL